MDGLDVYLIRYHQVTVVYSVDLDEGELRDGSKHQYRSLFQYLD